MDDLDLGRDAAGDSLAEAYPALTHLSDAELLASISAHAQKHASDVQLTLQLQATAQQRQHAVAIAPLWLAELENLRQRLQKQCEAICALSQAIVPAPDLEVRRARGRMKGSSSSENERFHAEDALRKRLPSLPDAQLSALHTRAKEAGEEYEQSFHRFEQGWDRIIDRAQGWASLPSRWHIALRDHGASDIGVTGYIHHMEQTIETLMESPKSWLEALSKNAAQGMVSSLEDVLYDLDGTARSILQSESGALASCTRRPSASPGVETIRADASQGSDTASPLSPQNSLRSPLQLLLHAIHNYHGANGVFAFAKAIFSDAVPLLGPSCARKSEVESFLLEFLDALQALGIDVDAPPAGAGYDGLPGALSSGDAIDSENIGGAAHNLVCPSPTLELELLTYIKASKQRAAQRRVRASDQSENGTYDYTDGPDAISPRSLSATFASTASQWYSNVAEGWSTFQDAATFSLSSIGTGNASFPASKQATETFSPDKAKPKKLVLYDAIHKPTAGPSALSSMSQGLCNFLTPASPVAPKFSASLALQQPALSGEANSSEGSHHNGSEGGRSVLNTSFGTHTESSLRRLADGSEGMPDSPVRTRHASIRTLPNNTLVSTPTVATFRGQSRSACGSPAAGAAAAAEESQLVDHAAEKLLEALVRSSDAAPASRSLPLVIALARYLLQDHFSRVAEPEAHRSLRMLILVRWWAFRHLRAMICDLYALSRNTPFSALASNITANKGLRVEIKLMEDTWLADPEIIEQLAALHRAVYSAVTKAITSQPCSPCSAASRRALQALIPDSRPLFSTPASPRTSTEGLVPGSRSFTISQMEFSALAKVLPQLSGSMAELSNAAQGLAHHAAVLFINCAADGGKARLSLQPPSRISPTGSIVASTRQGATGSKTRKRSGTSFSNPGATMLSSFTPNSGPGGSRVFSGWGSPIGSPIEVPLNMTQGAGFFDIAKPPNQLASGAQALQYLELPPEDRSDLRKAVYLLARQQLSLDQWKGLPTIIAAQASSCRRQRQWSDAVLLDWASTYLASNRSLSRDLLQDCLLSAYQKQSALRLFRRAAEIAIVAADSGVCRLCRSAQNLMASLHEHRALVWYATAIRTESKVRATWFTSPVLYKPEDIKHWMEQARVQSMGLDQETESLIMALDQGFGAIAGDASEFFEHPIWSPEAVIAKPFLKNASSLALSIEPSAVVLKEGACTATVLCKEQHRPPTLTGLETFLQKAQMRATGFFLMESQAGISNASEQFTDSSHLARLRPTPKSLLKEDDRVHLFRCIELHASPDLKMKAVHSLQLLVATSLMLRKNRAPSSSPDTQNKRTGRGTTSSRTSASFRPLSFVTTNRTNRVLSMHDVNKVTEAPLNLDAVLAIEQPQAGTGDALRTVKPEDILEQLEAALCETNLSQCMLNLQLVFAFAPSSILNIHDRGKATLDLALAALSVQRDRIESVVEFSR
ncbi:hypothetical protein K437DRAFT_259174 [Tilletiaria anomala UBC 951]|uniref:Uncharacterized protein n=1 Tax=Tilletiaria anomala (strain ATCC 24038 / CBS 436.72 / UBC 951) TaxID=1037660 RepID=A0A066VBN4_TILAU|nr:uncharacterized protein K437DRAFT_259174 [Tilletiaria anomala UBC 951]KDN39167.1 hypothetical protein K437DRAFT_259174 [Tilletiaria anomala UBC 951]